MTFSSRTRKKFTHYLRMARPTFGGSRDPDELVDFAGLIESRGFQLLSYDVTTQDGYILTLHRVVPKDFDPDSYCKTRKPIIVNHGLVACSNNYFITSPELTSETSKCGDNFGFGLLLTGRYDVWLSNNRGNGYSMKHVNLNVLDRNFWCFSFQQMAQYDLPATIDAVLKETGHKTVGYVGHSQGAAIMFALLSERPEEYGDVVRPFVAWAPAVFLGHMKSSLTMMSRMLPFFHKIGGELTVADHLISWIGENTCRNHLAQVWCANEMAKVHGPTDRLALDRLPVFFHYWPSPSSMWQIAHLGQLYKSKRFRKFDYGSPERNLKEYGSEKPPKYLLEKVPPQVPIVIMVGPTDHLVTPTDVELLYEYLKPNVKNLHLHTVPSKQFNHIDFLFGTNAGELVYDKTIEYLDQFA